MVSDTQEEVELWCYTTTSELLFLFEKNRLPTKPITELSVGNEIPEQDCIENIASLVWEELRQVAEYMEWYTEPEVSRLTWNRFADATVALKSSKAALLSQVPMRTVRVEEVVYTDMTDFSVCLPTDGHGNYPVDALGELFGVKSSTFDSEHAVRVLVVPNGILDQSDETFSYSTLESFDENRPKINIEPDELIQNVKVSPNAPPYAKGVIKDYLGHELGFESLV